MIPSHNFTSTGVQYTPSFSEGVPTWKCLRTTDVLDLTIPSLPEQ